MIKRKEQYTAYESLFSLTGRISRRSYLLYTVINACLCFALMFYYYAYLSSSYDIDIARFVAESEDTWWYQLCILALAYWYFALQVNRFHDFNRSGWWVLINLVPFVGSGVCLLAALFRPGTQGENKYGANIYGARRSYGPLTWGTLIFALAVIAQSFMVMRGEGGLGLIADNLSSAVSDMTRSEDIRESETASAARTTRPPRLQGINPGHPNADSWQVMLVRYADGRYEQIVDERPMESISKVNGKIVSREKVRLSECKISLSEGQLHIKQWNMMKRYDPKYKGAKLIDAYCVASTSRPRVKR